MLDVFFTFGDGTVGGEGARAGAVFFARDITGKAGATFFDQP